jgi:galacturonosyltransferase
MKRIMLVANRDFVLYNFRFELIQNLIKEGYDVTICLPYGPKVDLMTAAGAKFIPIEIDGRGKRLFRDLQLIKEIERVYTREKPDLVLLYTTKVCIYGGIVARKLGLNYFVSVSGLGTAVSNYSLIQPFIISLYKKSAEGANCVFFQNEESVEFFHKCRINSAKECITPGSGVNLEKWKYLEYPNGETIHFLFAGRMIKEKGIENYLKASKVIKRRYPNTVFHLAGPCDGNYGAVISDFERNGIIQYHGEVSDLAELFKNIHCLIHPSYYPEGVSNVCLEAAASGRAIITTDNPGCGITVDDGISGYIVKEKELEMLVCAIEKFLQLDDENRKKMGIEGREKMIHEFDRRVVLDMYMKEISEILGTN